MPLGMEVGFSPGDCVRWRPSLPSPKRGRSTPVFGACVLWPNSWMDQDGTWRGGGPWSRSHCDSCRPSSPPKKGGRAPNFRPIYCGQMAGCITMPLGMEVGLSPGDFVLDATQPPSPKRGQSPQFSAHVYCGWMDQDVTWYGGRPRPKRHCVTWGPSSPPKGTAPQFLADVYCGQTAVCIRILLGTEVGLSLGTLC